MFNTAELQRRMNDPEAKRHLSDPRFKALVQVASTSMPEFFELIQQEVVKFPDHAETLVRKARLVLGFRIEEDQEEEHVIDLKTGPMPIMRTQKRQGADDSFDLIVSVDTKNRFLGLMTMEEDGLNAYKSGAVRLVKGSMRALLKLRSLQELADRWREDFGMAAGSASGENSVIIPGTTPENEHSYQGYLEKQSDWLKKWNSRFVVLRWNEKSRPQLRFYTSHAASRTAPARHFIELHSGMECVPNTVYGDPYTFSLVDRRSSGRVLFVLRAPSERSLNEWLKAFDDAIICRSKALDAARRRLRGESLGSGEHGKAPAGGLLDLLLATQKVCTSHAEQLRKAEEDRRVARENIARLEARAQEAEDFMIYSTVERDVFTLYKYFGWKSVPIVAALAWILKKMINNTRSLSNTVVEKLGKFICDKVLPQSVSDRIGYMNVGSLASIALLSAYFKHVNESPSWELARRRWRVNVLAIFVIWRLKLSSMKAEYLPPMHAEAMWNVEFRTNAERLYLMALELRGLWVKSAQFMGARADVMPEAAIRVLKRLHDDVPATPFPLVKELVERELKAPLPKLFSSFEETVLASASIGQVHVAHLADGTRCVVKAQHPNVHERIIQDLKNMEMIISWVEFLEPDLEAKPLVVEWTKEVSKELEFDKESENMLDVGRNLASDPTIYAALPMPIKELVSKRVLVMHFVPGTKVNDLDTLRRVAGVETEQQRSNLAMDICNAFARQLFVDGIFQADAHPGNILVAARSSVDPKSVQHLPDPPADDPDRAIPILLDFGLTKRLPNNKRLAFSRLICAMQSLDIGQLLLSFDEMGLRLKREDPFEDLAELRFAFRETTNADESRAETLAHLKKAKEKYDSLPRDQRNPVEAFPSELMLFFRTVFLLRGLCTSLNVRVKYSKTMAAWARRALKEATMVASIPPSLSIGKRSLEENLRTICETQTALGCQVHCVRFDDTSSTCLADFAYGRLHEVDFRPVTAETLFPCLALAQSVSQLVGRAVLERHLNSKVGEIWTDFSSGNVLSVAGLLSGDHEQMSHFPLSHLPEKFSVATMHKWRDHLAAVKTIECGKADEAQSALPWEMAALAFSWGWTIAGCIQALAPKQKDNDAGEPAMATMLAETIAPKLGQGCLVRLRAPDTELPLPAPKKGCSPAEEEEIVARRDAHREHVNSQYAALSIDIERVSGGAIDLDKMLEVQSAAEVPTGTFDATSFLNSLGPTFKGKEYLVDPRIMNSSSARSAMAPNCNLLANARGLARLFAAIGNGGVLDKAQIVAGSVAEYFAKDFIKTPEKIPAALEPLGERLGMKIFELKHTETGETVRGFGQIAFGGSIVLCVPSAKISVSVLVNDLTLDRDLPRTLVEECLREAKLKLVSEI